MQVILVIHSVFIVRLFVQDVEKSTGGSESATTADKKPAVPGEESKVRYGYQ